jgi:hypothetical protein
VLANLTAFGVALLAADALVVGTTLLDEENA